MPHIEIDPPGDRRLSSMEQQRDSQDSDTDDTDSGSETRLPLNDHHGDFSTGVSNYDKEIKSCWAALFLTDPEIDRQELTSIKGRLVNGTCEWIRENEFYRSWLGSGTQLLSISGSPGKGKTMLSLFLTEELERLTQETENSELIFYFCRQQGDKCGTAVAILRGLIYQIMTKIATKHPTVMDHVLPFFESTENVHLTASSLESLWILFTNLVKDPSLGTLFCVIDGLDQCDRDSTRFLLTKFAKFFSPESSELTGSELKMVIVSREISGLEMFPWLEIDQDFKEEVNGDIQRFVSIKTKELSRIEGFTEHLREHIQGNLLRRAGGTFLWLGPVMDELLRQKTCVELLMTLDSFPVELATAYGQILLRIDSHQREAASQILRWVVMARRPLTLNELAVAIDIKPLPPLSSDQTIRGYISLCESFVTINKDEVSLIHQSAKDYLLRENPDSNPILERFFRVLPEKAHYELAKACLSHLQKSDLHIRPVHFHDSPDLPIEPLWEGPFHVRDILCGDVRAADEQSSQKYLQAFPLLRYAVLNWPEHARLSSGCAAELFDPAQPFFQENSVLRRNWWATYEASKAILHKPWYHVSVLHIASFFGIVPWVRKLLSDAGKRDEPENIEDGYTELEMAVYGGNVPVVKLLLEYGYGMFLSGRYGRNPYYHAVMHQDYAVVQVFLENDAAMYDPDPTFCAVGQGNERMVKLILDFYAKIEVEEDGLLLLQFAVLEGNEKMVKLLIDRGAKIDAKNKRGQSAFHIAVQNGLDAMVKLLLRRGAKINAKDADGLSALHIAASRGYDMIVRLLLVHGANINSVTRSGITAVDLAIIQDHDAIVQLLLDRGAILGDQPDGN